MRRANQAAIIKAQSAGELQAMIGFLQGRTARSPLGALRLELLAYGIGQPRDEDLIVAQDALRRTLNRRLDRQLSWLIREFQHE